MRPAQLPRTDVVQTAGLPIGVAAGVSAMAVLLFGVVPAFVAVRRNPSSPARLDARGGIDSRQRRRVRHGLVAAQIALAVVMLAGAGLLARTLQRLEQLNLGYRTGHLSILENVDSVGEVRHDAEDIAAVRRHRTTSLGRPGRRSRNTNAHPVRFWA